MVYCIGYLLLFQNGHTNYPERLRKIGTLHYNWPVSADASQAFSTSSVPIVWSFPDKCYLQTTDKKF